MRVEATPETDKAGKFWPCEQLELVDSDFARRLERERDEARCGKRVAIAERDEAIASVSDGANNQ